MKNYILMLLLTVMPFSGIFAQEEEVKDKPVRAPFASGYLIDNQTTMIPIKGTLEFAIQHKFGTIENGKSDFFGIYAPAANIRLALDYVFFKNFQAGIGLSKERMYTDLNAKWTILEQTRENTIPVAVALYGVVAIDGRNESAFGTGKTWHSGEGKTEFDFNFPDRLSYFSQLIIGRKFNHWLSLQTGVSFTHYNLVDPEFDHDKIGLHFNGRINFSPQSSFIFNYDAPLKIQQISEQLEVPPHHQSNVSFGVEIATSTHAFQIYMGNSKGIIPQDIMMWNSNKFSWENLAFGFTITRIWNF
ncbi:hypothetical protein SAMN05444274_106279 [Mariniphaga anaerophila]|uniref:DUF5777 domain-containing protein n=1 Tax=Mariniphaga anaerophila TaxID=1484053 RepID=A0A1M5CVF2_9BACT|nr:DUF5777 family beta-barrel protein [Mariniphaga anaerophila]SHF58587.1 hypothetical protein SAMN05444274_106279 [Mariniphaga anaerophila]